MCEGVCSSVDVVGCQRPEVVEGVGGVELHQTSQTRGNRQNHYTCTGHLRYLEIKGNGETTSSFAKFEISKLRPANVLRKSQLFHILGLSGSPFHHDYHIDSDFKRIFPDLTHDFKMFFNNSSDERLCVDIKDRFLTL